MSSTSELTIVHLASASLGAQPLRSFVSSYSAYSAGLAHELVIVFNGFRDSGSVTDAGFSTILEGIPHHPIYEYPLAIDVVAYLEIGRGLSSGFACFLNASSVILSHGWLRKLYRGASQPGVGIVGATGSFETHRRGAPGGPKLVRRARGSIALRARRNFPPFPNPHIRTNAFMIRPELLRTLDVPPVRTKAEAYRFESGRRGLTALIRKCGLEAEVVGRNGQSYSIKNWPSSGTFRSGGQSNLLVSDNRTREWASADATRREILTSAAWGD